MKIYAALPNNQYDEEFWGVFSIKKEITPTQFTGKYKTVNYDGKHAELFFEVEYKAFRFSRKPLKIFGKNTIFSTEEVEEYIEKGFFSEYDFDINETFENECV